MREEYAYDADSLDASWCGNGFAPLLQAISDGDGAEPAAPAQFARGICVDRLGRCAGRSPCSNAIRQLRPRTRHQGFPQSEQCVGLLLLDERNPAQTGVLAGSNLDG